MTIGEFLSTLWHRKLIVIGVTVVAILAAIGSLMLISPQYESTSTLSLNPPETSGLNSLAFFQTIDPLVSIYATAAETQSTKETARTALGGRLGSISVHTFSGSPIFKISARDTNRSVAQRSAQAVTDVLLHRASDGSIGLSSLRLSQLDRPAYPQAQVFPDRRLTLGVAILLGLGLGIAAAFLRETIGSRIRTRTELAEAAGVPVYAELPITRAAKRPVPVDRLLADPSMSVFHEALRELQTNLMFGDHRSDSILITSPEGRHGKSTVAVGLALSMAQAGVRTILVDADLRRGTIAERLRLQQVRGLTEVLDGAPLATCIQHTPVRELDVLASGRLIAESGELIASRFPVVLERLSEMYEMVVIDTTPLVPVNDARVLASFVKSTIIVAMAGKASKHSVEEAVERLAFLGIRPTGTVLNKSKRKSVGSYYAYEVHGVPTSPQAEPEAVPQKHSATSP